MKTLIAAVMAVMISTAAHAVEVWEFSEHEEWVVDLVQFEDGIMACAANTSNPEQGISLTLWDYNDGTYGIQVYDHTFDFRGTDGTISFRIDQGQIWDANAHFTDNSIFVYGLHDTELLGEIMGGIHFYVLDRFDEWTHGFTLQGSLAAVLSMIDCAQQIDNGPVYNEGRSSGPQYNETY